MALSKEISLRLMKECFPSWTDIRKRTSSSLGGGLLTAYAHEADQIWQAILDYRAFYFLVNHNGHEEDFPDYLYLAMVGEHDSITVADISCEITEYEDEFLNDLSHKVLYEGGYLLFHESILPDEENTTQIAYAVNDEENIYRIDLEKQSIWNVFDEFALFAGLKRYENESNKELSERTYAAFKNWANPSEAGLRHAIENAIVPDMTITDEDIEIIPFSSSKFDLTRQEFKNIYESFVSLNHDLFRTKRWNKDLWEHLFQKTEYIPHVWDEPMKAVQDGVGYNDSLKTDYLKRLGYGDTTDVTLSTYQKDFEKIRQYIGRTD